MTKNTAQTGPAASQPELPLSVTELTTLLQMVNQLFPLPERPAKLSTREGRAYKQAVAQREAYIKALQAAITHATTVNRLNQEIELNDETAKTDAASYAEQIGNLERSLNLVGPYMILAISLGLLVQRRPETMRVHTSTVDGLVVSCTIGDMGLTVLGKKQCFRLTAPSMQPRTFDFDDEGNLLDESFERLLGYLALAGHPVNPEHAKLALRTASRNTFYSDPNAKITALMRALGRTAVEGAGVSFTKGGTRGNPAGTAHAMGMFTKSGLGWDFEPSLSMQDDEPPLDLYLFGTPDTDDVSLLRGKPRAMDNLSARLRERLAALGTEQSGTDYVFIITDGMSHPGDQKG